MKGLVVYDTVYGNTKLIAESIAEQIRAEGHTVDLRSAREGIPDEVAADFAFVGSPTRMAKMTRRAKKSVKVLAKGGWGDRPIFLFDTVMVDVDKEGGKWSGKAADKLHDLAKESGLRPRSPVLHIEVTGMKGPLASDATEKARAYVRDALASVGK